METLSKKASKTMLKLIEQLGKSDHASIDNTNGTFMPVVIERLYKDEMGTVYSVSHYYKQNGDLMRDPDMEFLDHEGHFIPIMFRQDNPPIYQESMWKDGIGWKLKRRLQKDHAKFANMWMRNIESQQKL